MEIVNLDQAEPFRTKDGSEIRELLAHRNSSIRNQSLAEASIPVGGSTMKPFPPAAPNGRRSFPTENRSRGVGEWNHYYIRAMNGEVRLWVNGKEVSGGTECNPRTGYLCLESEGSPVEFRNLRLRELP